MLGSFFGTGAGAGLNILAQLFFTPSGITLEVILAAAAAVVDAASAAAPLQVSAGLVASPASGASLVFGAESHAVDSSVGTESSEASFVRAPFVCTVVAPRPLPPLPRSFPRPRPPRPPS